MASDSAIPIASPQCARHHVTRSADAPPSTQTEPASAVIDSETTLTAWHEAGHAIGYLAHHRRFRYVTLRPRTPGTLGIVAVRPRLIDTFVLAVIAHIGPMAQGLYDLSTYGPGELEDEGYEPEDAITGAYLHGGCDDLAKIQECVRVHGRGADAAAEQIARTILTDRWTQVQEVAQALLEHRTLSYAAVLDVAQAVGR